MARWPHRKRSLVRVDRPGIVTAIALTQFAKAGIILAVSWIVWQRPSAEFRLGMLWSLSDVLTTGRSGADFMAPVFAGYALAVGCGLWHLEKWARGTLMVTSGLTATVWVVALTMRNGSLGSLSDRFSLLSYDLHSLYAMVFIDAAVFLYLAFGRDVPEAFHRLDPPHL
jgi:hypothetical protein